MNIIVSIHDYRETIENIPAKGKWQAWLDHYYSRYRQMFDIIFKFLYMADVQAMKPHVEACDFAQCLKRFEAFIEHGGLDKTRETLTRSEELLGYGSEFGSDYDVFIMAGIGHTGGTAPPAPNPFIYLGTEVIGSDPAKISSIVSHEFHHLARIRMLGMEALKMAAFTFAELILTEGLATAFSVMIQDQDLDFGARIMKTALNMTDGALSYCVANHHALIREILSLGESQATPELTVKYLYSGPSTDSQGRPGNVGYYVGAAIVMDILRNSRNAAQMMQQLTRMSGREILQLWREAVDRP